MDHDSSRRGQGRVSMGLSEVVGGRNARDVRGQPDNDKACGRRGGGILARCEAVALRY